MTSPLLTLPGAVAGNGIDALVAAHYGSFYAEQRCLEAGDGFVDLSHRDVFAISGQDRLALLHSLTTQYFTDLVPKVWTQALVLSPQGHVEHEFQGYDDGSAFIAHAEPGSALTLKDFLERMRFMMRVEVEPRPDLAVCWRPGPGGESRYDFVDRDKLASYAEAAGNPCGTWAFEALRIARGEPRFGLDTDHRTIPNEVGWIGPAVHLEKGCYRGQETVARVHTLGRPPRRLTRLHLDGTENRLPPVGHEIIVDGRPVGFVGTSARHHELGPIAFALVKRNVSLDVVFDLDGMPASQEVVVDPEVGLHVRPRLS